jgi:cytochrome c oxidase subunit 4
MTKTSIDSALKPHAVPVEHPSEHKDHVVSPLLYLAIFVALLVFTGITTAAAFADLGVLNPIVALAIATTKATLVVLFFMHVKYSAQTTKLTVISAIFFFGILCVMSMSDYISRSWATW